MELVIHAPHFHEQLSNCNPYGQIIWTSCNGYNLTTGAGDGNNCKLGKHVPGDCGVQFIAINTADIYIFK